MTDRELLEAAAKAAGIVVHRGESWQSQTLFREIKRPNSPLCANVEWNPLEDDGDAFRLAVKLQLRVLPPEDEFGLDRASVRVHSRRDLVDAYHADPCAATRLAIVRAAAAMAQGEQP